MAKKLYDVGWGFNSSSIEDSVRTALEETKIPLTKDNNRYITFRNIKFEKDPRADSSASIKEAVVYEKSILTKIKADVVEYDGASSTTKAHGVQIGQLPQFIDSRKTFMITGSEYNIINQPRRKSSVYVYSGGGTAKADFNLAKGRNFSIEVDPRSGFAVMTIGGSSVALRVLLESLGVNRMDLVSVTDEEFARDHWDTLNKQSLLNNYRKLYSRLFEYKQEDVRKKDLDEIKEAAKEYFEQTSVDPQTTKYLFDTSYNKIDKRFILDIVKKFNNVNKGDEKGIDPDDLYYQKLYPPNMLFKDRIERIMPELANNVRQKIRLGHDTARIFSNILSKYLVGMVNSSDLSRLDPQYNPIGMYVASSKISPIGMGGIQDVNAVTRSKRGVHASYMGVIDPTSTAQGQNVGIQLNLVDSVKIDEEGDIYLPLKDRFGKKQNMKLADMYDKKLLLPGMKDNKETYAMYRGEIQPIKAKGYDYEFPDDTSNLFSNVNKLVPFPQAVQGNRSFMTARQITQAVPLVHGEAPLVEPVDDNGISTYRTLRKDLESLLPMESPWNGEVLDVGNGIIKIREDDGTIQKFQYHEHLPFATNTGVHQEPKVKKGDRVRKGQMLVKDAYTTDDGKVALGRNLKVAYMPYYGENTEDGLVISEDAAEKLTSAHYYTYNTPDNDTFTLDKKRFRQMFGAKYQGILDFDKYDERGALKKGAEISPGEPVFLIIEKRTPDDKLNQLGKISRNIILDMIDGSQIYNQVSPGKVVDVASSPKYMSVTVVTEEKAVIGDKLTGLDGNKATVSRIIPNDKMIQDAEGLPIDAIYSSTTIVSRINPAQVYENALGKIVEKTGRGHYMVPLSKNPTKDDLGTFVQKELKKYGIQDKERVFNPVSGKHIKRPIATGQLYMMKLLKGDKDITARSIGPGYSSSGVPSKGGKEGAKAFGAAEYNALVAHNARTFLTDAGNIKSQKNDEYWKRLEMGLTEPVKAESQAWNKAKSLITAAGGYVKQNNSTIQMMPLTDKITDELAQHRIILTPALLNSKSLDPIKRGLFDPSVTGGPKGTLWSKIPLEDGIVSPLVEEYMRLVLGNNAKEMRDWQVNNSASAMKKDLRKIDMDKKIKELKDKSKTNDLSNAEIKVLRFLKNLKDSDTKLEDLIINKLPVPPPIHRPITTLDNGNVQIADLNMYYKDVMLANDALKSTKGTAFAPEAKAVLLDNIKALVGTAPTKNVQLQKKNTRGILTYLGGAGSPKQGYIHSTLIKKNQDLSGRARIIANSRMSMDEIGLPEKMAWKLFEPHVMRKLKKTGITPIRAATMIKEKHPTAKNALEHAMNEMHVLGNRAPTLHRFGVLAFKPKMVPGTSIHLNLAATKPLNADFDGDAIQIHVPSSEKVSKSIERFTLSKMPFSDEAPGSLVTGLHTEAILGLYQMSLEDPKQFKKDVEAIVGPRYEIEIPMGKKESKKLLAKVAELEPIRYSIVFDKLRNIGEMYATDIGSTVGVEDVMPMIKERDVLVTKYRKQLDKAITQKDRAVVLQAAQNEAKTIALRHPGDLTLLVKSGAKGSDMQLSSILVSPMLSYDPDKPLETAELTPSGYGEGLNMKDMWLQNIKIRKDAVGTALNVAVPGSLGKLMVYNTLKEVITIPDCGTKAGVLEDWNSSNILGRVLQEDVPGMKRGTIINPANVSSLPKRQILVRSPMKCAAHEGICQKCYGTDSQWHFYEVGTHVGIRAAHAIVHPLQQRALDSKHGGRDLSRDVGKGGLQDLLNVFSSNMDKADVATLAKQKDTVESVEIRRGATHLIHMDSGDKYRVHPESEIIVKRGDKVIKGQPITKGVIPYTEVTRLMGINAGRKALVNDFQELLGENSPVHNRLAEVIAKGAVNYLEVMSAFDKYLPGDNINYNDVVKLGEEKGISMEWDKIDPGMSLAEEVGDLSVGHSLTQDDIDEVLKKMVFRMSPGRKKFKVFPEHVRFKPSVKSFYTSGMLADDWIENLAQKYIKKTITSAAAEGKSAKTRSISPIAPWLTGRPFQGAGPNF